MKSLKNYQPQLVTFIFINLILLGFDNYISLELKKIDINTLKLVPIPSILILCTYIFNGILTSDIKYKIVFFRWKNPLPASRLQKVVENDPRINLELIIEKYGPIPNDPKKQNFYWYQKLYKVQQDVEKVRDIHRNFLMTRDMSAICFMILIISAITSLFSIISPIHVLIVLFEFLIIRRVSCNYGNRFVATVVAEAI